MNEQNLYWIGIQESEIADVKNLFAGSITIFGSGKNCNYAFDKETHLRFNYNKDNQAWSDFVNAKAKKIIIDNPNCKFLLYYPMDAKDYSDEFKRRAIAINEPYSLDVLDNKFKCREWLCNDVPTIPQQFLSGEQLIKNNLRIFEDGNEYVIQGEYSCGGSGTWLYTKNSCKRILKFIEKNKIYSFAPYIKHNIPVNIHIVVYKNEIRFLPASVQLISLTSDEFEYIGADFITYRNLPKPLQNKVIEYSLIIGKRLQHSGFCGVFGIDYIVTLSEVYFMEINPRFQSSTILINKALIELNRPYSVQHLHIDAFQNNVCSYNNEKFEVNYSYRKFVFRKKDRDKLQYFQSCAQNNEEIEYIDDGLSSDLTTEEQTYLFKVIFKRNISAISNYFNLIIHPVLESDNSIVNFNDVQNYLPQLKIMLLSHGVMIEKNTAVKLAKSGKLNCKEFEALDMILNEKIYINVPYKTNLSELSPFNLRYYKNELYLFYLNRKLLKLLKEYATTK